MSTCYGDCAKAWPIFTAEGDPLTLPADIEGELTLIERTDGSTQIAYNGIPLYYWQADQQPGDATGQGVGDVWFVVAPGSSLAIAPQRWALLHPSPRRLPSPRRRSRSAVRQNLANSSQMPKV
ncbi:MAG: hypothetical protein R2839_01775 [Thermomicrobiales bacterium]